jgi:predicted O-linked N-acetylglucosamine transferase (SPINDLY family)
MAGEAIELIERAHRISRPSARSLNDLGTAYLAARRAADARRCFKKALALRGDDAEVHAKLGRALMQLGQTVAAEECLRRSTALRPENAYAWSWLGDLLHRERRLADAEQSFRRASALDPRNPAILNSLGIVIAESGRPAQAEATFRSAIESVPDHLPALHNLGNVLKDLGRPQEAESVYRRVLAYDPEAFATRVNLATALKELGRMEEAIGELCTVLSAHPDLAEVHYALGNALYLTGRTREAQRSYRRALELNPDLDAARWEAAMNQLPAVYGPDEDPAACRDAFAHGLRELNGWLDGHSMDATGETVGTPPFHLAYQEEDNRSLMMEYGGACARVLGQWPDLARLRPPARLGRKDRVRVGIVSAHLRDHSVWSALVKGWVLNLNRDRIELNLFHLDSREDSETQLARAKAAKFIEGESGLRAWVDTILDCQPDVLIYPEIGMDALTAKLASLRLAPVQVASWGHPQTTGLPTIDYYLSAEGLEGSGAAEHYSERLVLLPGLGCCVDPVVATETAAAPRVREEGAGSILVCPGTPLKYAPKYDWIYPEIAARLGRCRFVFFDHFTQAYSAKLRSRLAAAFAERGMRFEDSVVSVPWQSRGGFHAVLREADVYLDTLGFSGFNTALQGVEAGLPVVTREDRFLRGRLAGGILRRLGLQGLVAPTTDAYVDLVVDPAKDRERRSEIRGVMQREKRILYGDPAPAIALEAFLTGVAQTGVV